MAEQFELPEVASTAEATSEASIASVASLAEILSSTADPAASKVSFSSPPATAYLSHLTTLPLDTLLSEPTTLSSTSAQLTNALTTLCNTNYRTFLSLHRTNTTLSTTLASVTASLSSLLSSSLPELEASTRAFSGTSKAVQDERRTAAAVREQHDKLRDLLEIPTLADACVRGGHFAEALALAAHTRALPNVPIVADVQAEVDAALRGMLAQLLAALREQAKLPALFKAASFLRRMGVLAEDELALAFLASRAAYLDASFAAVEAARTGEREAHARFLKRYVDAWREGVHDLVTQYTAIFLERTPPPPPVVRALLTTLAAGLVERLLDTLRSNVRYLRGDPAALASLLTQLTYCAASFARVGMDFGAHLAPIFYNEVRAGVTEAFSEASASFVDAIKNTGTKSPSEVLITPSAGSNPPVPPRDYSVESSPPHVAPHILTSYPPLALYTNALLTALNGLRLLAPQDLLGDAVEALDASLVASAEALLQINGEGEEKGLVGAARQVFGTVFVPFVRRALVEGVYGVRVEGAWVPGGRLGEVLDRMGEA